MAASASGIKAAKAYVELVLNSDISKGLKRAEMEMRNFANKVTAIGTQSFGMGAAMLTPIALAVKQFAEFDDTLRIVQAVTRSTATELQMLSDKARLIGKTTTFTSQQVASAMEQLGRSGFNARQINTMIKHVMNLSRATRTPISVSAEVSANTLRQFGLQAKDIERVVDALTNAANNSSQTVEDLAASMRYVAPVAKDFGVSVEQTAAMVGKLANMGIRGEMAGTSLRNIFAHLSSQEVLDVYESIGVKVRDASGNVKNLEQLLTEAGQRMKELKFDAIQRAAFTKEAGGLRSMSGMTKMTDTGVDFTDLIESIMEGQGAAERAAQEMDKSLGSVILVTISAIQELGNVIAESLVNELQKLKDWIVETVNAFGYFIKYHKDLLLLYANTGKYLVEIGVLFFTLGSVVRTFSTVLGGAIGIFKGLIFIFPYLIGNLASVVVTVLRMKVAFNGLSDVLRATAFVMRYLGVSFTSLIGPIGIAAVAITGLVAVLSSLKDRRLKIEVSTNAQEKADEIKRIKESQKNIIDDLEKINSKQARSNEDLEKAESLVEELQKQWGYVGLSVNKTKREIEGLTEAQEKLNEKQKDQIIESNEVAARELERNITAGAGEMQDILGRVTSKAEAGDKTGAKDTFGSYIREKAYSVLNQIDDQGNFVGDKENSTVKDVTSLYNEKGSSIFTDGGDYQDYAMLKDAGGNVRAVLKPTEKKRLNEFMLLIDKFNAKAEEKAQERAKRESLLNENEKLRNGDTIKTNVVTLPQAKQDRNKSPIDAKSGYDFNSIVSDIRDGKITVDENNVDYILGQLQRAQNESKEKIDTAKTNYEKSKTSARGFLDFGMFSSPDYFTAENGVKLDQDYKKTIGVLNNRLLRSATEDEKGFINGLIEQTNTYYETLKGRIESGNYDALTGEDLKFDPVLLGDNVVSLLLEERSNELNDQINDIKNLYGVEDSGVDLETAIANNIIETDGKGNYRFISDDNNGTFVDSETIKNELVNFSNYKSQGLRKELGNVVSQIDFTRARGNYSRAVLESNLISDTIKTIAQQVEEFKNSNPEANELSKKARNNSYLDEYESLLKDYNEANKNGNAPADLKKNFETLVGRVYEEGNNDLINGLKEIENANSKEEINEATNELIDTFNKLAAFMETAGYGQDVIDNARNDLNTKLAQAANVSRNKIQKDVSEIKDKLDYFKPQGDNSYLFGYMQLYGLYSQFYDNMKKAADEAERIKNELGDVSAKKYLEDAFIESRRILNSGLALLKGQMGLPELMHSNKMFPGAQGGLGYLPLLPPRGSSGKEISLREAKEEASKGTKKTEIPQYNYYGEPLDNDGDVIMDDNNKNQKIKTFEELLDEYPLEDLHERTKQAKKDYKMSQRVRKYWEKAVDKNPSKDNLKKLENAKGNEESKKVTYKRFKELDSDKSIKEAVNRKRKQQNAAYEEWSWDNNMTGYDYDNAIIENEKSALEVEKAQAYASGNYQRAKEIEAQQEGLSYEQQQNYYNKNVEKLNRDSELAGASYESYIDAMKEVKKISKDVEKGNAEEKDLFEAQQKADAIGAEYAKYKQSAMDAAAVINQMEAQNRPLWDISRSLSSSGTFDAFEADTGTFGTMTTELKEQTRMLGSIDEAVASIASGEWL